jgi:hypothetical protein
MGLDDDEDPTAGRTEEVDDIGDVDMDFEETTEEFLENLEKNSVSTSLQKEAARSAGTGSGTTTTTGTTTGTTAVTMEGWQLRKNSSASTSTSATTTTGMKKIDEEDEEEEDELKMKTRNWRKINLSFTVELDGQDGEDIKDTDQQFDGDNDNKMRHHPIMSKIAKFMIAIEKKCNTVKIMSSKKQMVLDSKACIDSWSINEVKTFFAYSIAKKRNRNVQVILYIDYGKTGKIWTMKTKVFDTLKAEGLWIVNHNGPTEIVETTQIGFFAGVHPELYRKGWEDNINHRIKEYYDNNSSEMNLRAHEIPELKDFLGPLPDVQIIPLNIPGMKEAGKNQKALAMGVSVPASSGYNCPDIANI